MIAPLSPGPRLANRALAVAFLVCLIATGCIPYWSQPSAPDGRLARGRCPVPPNTLVFTLGTVDTFVFAYQDRQQLSVGMRFSVPAERAIRLLASEAVVRLSDRPDEIMAHFDEIRLLDANYRQLSIPVSTTMAGSSRPVAKGSSRLAHQMFWITTTVTTAETRPFTIDFPQFAIDGQPMTLPRVTFAPKHYQGVLQPINC